MLYRMLDPQFRHNVAGNGMAMDWKYKKDQKGRIPEIAWASWAGLLQVWRAKGVLFWLIYEFQASLPPRLSLASHDRAVHRSKRQVYWQLPEKVKQSGLH